jgi:hypothetical protein
MGLSVLDLYGNVLPKTNCGECGFPTCLAFASMVISEKLSLERCRYLSPEVVAECNAELQTQYADGKWTKKDMVQDALDWAKQRSASMDMQDVAQRINARPVERDGQLSLELPYFNEMILITKDDITFQDGRSLSRWEQVFVRNHMAQGGSAEPTGSWKGLVEFPNTVSKVKSMRNQVEVPLEETFKGKVQQLRNAAVILGGRDVTHEMGSADAAFYFQALPRVPVLLMFWDAEPEDGFEPEARLLFDETITDHLDIESIMFLSERLGQFLCGMAQEKSVE